MLLLAVADLADYSHRSPRAVLHACDEARQVVWSGSLRITAADHGAHGSEWTNIDGTTQKEIRQASTTKLVRVPRRKERASGRRGGSSLDLET